MNRSEHHSDAHLSQDMTSSPQNFRSDPDSQVFGQQPQYQYGAPHHSSSNFAIDTEMANMDSFTAGVPDTSNNEQMGPSGVGNNSTSHAHSSSNAGGGNLGAAIQLGGPNTSGMAPPQPITGHGVGLDHGQGQQLSYSPGARGSVDENADPSLMGGDPKRKRSKVSRACDECRRKKVRCDAAADDGTIKTCTNCAKAGVPCGYNRIPMKRGPSKGYIKELSERVQQVESQMAMSSTPNAFRQSLDAGTANNIYPDTSLYSPDDMAFKRNFSFSDQQPQRSPFTNPEYNRDRIPSIGWNAVSPHMSGFRGSFGAGDRHRGSLAIAPDQQLPTSTVNTFVKPFWADSISGSPRAAKRRKLDTGSGQHVHPPTFTQESLSKYYSEFHTNLPILPDVDAAIEAIGRASPDIQHAFAASVRFLPAPKSRLQNGQTDAVSIQSGDPPIKFKRRGELEDFMWEIAREDPESRSRDDNLLLLWTYLFMAVEAENDLSRLRNTSLSKALIIKQAVDLAWKCTSNREREKNKYNDKSTVDSVADDISTKHWARAWYCAGVLARLQALAVGSSNPIPFHCNTPLPKPGAVLSPTETFLALAAGMLGSIIHLVQNFVPPTQYGRFFDTSMRQQNLSHLDDLVSMAQLDGDAEVQAQHIQLFYNLLLSRFTFLGAPFEVLEPAVNLAEALKQHTVASEERIIYNPWNMHFFTLTTITLLEFIQDGVDNDLGKSAREALDKIRTALEQLSEKDHVEDEQAQAQTQTPSKETNGDTTNAATVAVAVAVAAASASATNATADDEEDEEDETTFEPPIHWTDALLSMIDQRTKATDMINQNGTGNGNGNGNGNGTGNNDSGNGDGNGTENGHRPVSDGRNEYTVAIDFSRLVRYGYLNVLAESVGI